MASEITMPQLSDTMTEGKVIAWNKKEGDKVKAGDEVAEVETDKATMPMEVFEGGTIAHIAVPAGETVKVGALLAVIATGKEDVAEVKKKYSGAGGGGGKTAAAPAGSAPGKAAPGG